MYQTNQRLFTGKAERTIPIKYGKQNAQGKRRRITSVLENFQMGILGKCKEVIFALQETEALP